MGPQAKTIGYPVPSSGSRVPRATHPQAVFAAARSAGAYAPCFPAPPIAPVAHHERSYLGQGRDDQSSCLFTVTVHRKEEKSSEKSSEKILELLKAEPNLAAREVAERLENTQRAVEKQIAKPRKDGRLRRIGPARGGRQEVTQ